MSRRMDKENVVHAYNGGLLSLKRKESLQHVTMQINLEDIVLSEKSQSQNRKTA